MSLAPNSEAWIRMLLLKGMVIPAHPLALTAQRKLDEDRQAALTRYYLDAGAGGIAVGVHTTQFSIRDPKHNLYEQVLRLAADSARTIVPKDDTKLLIAGICGDLPQATREARLAFGLGFHAGLLSMASLRESSEEGLLEFARAVASEIPLFGFYLQPAVGGRVLPYSFWRRFVEIPNVVAIKVAPFNRYQTLDVVRAVAESGRAGQIGLYTGNDDAIVHDLITEFRIGIPTGEVRLRFSGGLLGHWACWTRSAVALFHRCIEERERGMISHSLLSLAQQVTETNAAIFDAAHDYRGCIAGIHEALRRDGLLDGIWCLDPAEALSPGQAELIDRVCRIYPELTTA